ncbi:peptidase M23 [Actinoplanes sp. SE50]|uniref:M23 family metallopeptidase n=1 Tax=unclassified Actinoplanes TaxID=2626549 RepID=UPI00023EE03C|nr:MULTISPECIES: M23 family metallopeptidase [unclassified Actinoplanes]AEV88962.1 Morphogenesis protein 1 [Actinoplanes sp. SE50/110]ATO87368.1 peptidase M23 [Actinoplanes sp. SE50]SLM04786.1 peptidase M23 [Actinoplanes sp. SE50/110]
MKFRASKKAVLLTAVVTTLALLCCGGSITFLVFGEISKRRDQTSTNTASFGCGQGGPIALGGKLPQVRQYGSQQVHNAAVIVNVGAALKMPPRAWVIAVATAMQESGLSNLGNLGSRNDHDSLGLFQQRPSSGWGKPAQLQDPEYAATKFYEKLKTIQGWENMSLTRAAQAVQISAYPDAYAKHEPAATQMVNLLAHGAANAVGNSLAMNCARAGQIAASGWTIPVKAIVGSGFRGPDRPNHQGVDLIVGRYTPILAAASGIVSVVKCDEDFKGRKTCDVDGYPGKGGCGWMVEIQHAGNIMTRYCHMVQMPFVHVNQKVTAGQVIGRVGTSGNSSGPHLHFEVHLNYDRSSNGAINPVPFMQKVGAPLGGAE